jgi:hypothetical protein
MVPLPPLPKDKRDILFVDEKKENAYWRRLEFPKIWYDFIPYDIPKGPRATKLSQKATIYDQDGYLLSLSESDTELLQRLLAKELHRRRYGVWMKNGEEFVHLPGGYYTTLQWVQMKDLPEKYGGFRMIQCKLLTVWEFVKWHIAHLGLNVPKCKKSGVSQIIAGDYINDSTLNSGWEMRLASKEYDSVLTPNMDYFFHGFDNLPMIMKPEVQKRNEHEIIFGKPKNRAGSNEGYLNTHLEATKTKPTCFDGPVIKRGWIDEMPKVFEASRISVDTLYKKTLETVRLQQKKNGALIATSYMPEVDDKGFKEWASLIMRSRRINEENGTTETMYINFPISAVQSNEVCFDKYGRCDEEKARRLVLVERSTKKTSSDIQAHKRTNPLDENDMFDAGGKGTAFDNVRLSLRARDLKSELESGNRPYREGHLRWKNSLWEDGYRPKDHFCEVYFEELTPEQLAAGEEGSILLPFDLKEEHLNQVIKLNHRAEDGYLAPLPTSLAVGAWDPTDYKLKRDVAEGSKNAAYGGWLDDPALDTYYGEKVTNVPLFEYLYRHDNPDFTEEDLYKLMIYFGMRFAIEANKGWLVTSAKLAGMHHFLLLMQSNGAIEPYKEGDENGLINTTRDMINVYCRSIAQYIAAAREGGVDWLKLIRFLRLVTQLANFEVLDPKKYDAVVAFGWWRVVVDAFALWLINNPPSGDDGAMQAALAELLHL